MSGWVIVLMGVSGCGKTTVGNLVSEGLGCKFIEGDEFHSAENVVKMGSGQPLNDDDRRDWLSALNRSIGGILFRDERAVLACSALKGEYREWLVEGLDGKVFFVYLKGDFDEINKRMQERQGHYMKAGMLASQFEALEEPEDVPTFELVLGSTEIARLIMDLPEIREEK